MKFILVQFDVFVTCATCAIILCEALHINLKSDDWLTCGASKKSIGGAAFKRNFRQLSISLSATAILNGIHYYKNTGLIGQYLAGGTLEKM
jgi:hypothetical protein